MFTNNDHLSREMLRQFESRVNVSLTGLLSCRLREGYTIRNVEIGKGSFYSSDCDCSISSYHSNQILILLGEGKIIVTLALQWKHNVNMEYIITSRWPPGYESPSRIFRFTFFMKSSWIRSFCRDVNSEEEYCDYKVTIDGSYYFLHDVTCKDAEKSIRAPYRKINNKEFWNTLKWWALSPTLKQLDILSSSSI